MRTNATITVPQPTLQLSSPHRLFFKLNCNNITQQHHTNLCIRCIILRLQLYPEGATCDDVDANATTTGILNCTEGPNGAYDFAVAEPLAFSRNAATESTKINGSSFLEALDLCCEKVRRVPACLSDLWAFGPAAASS
jgi:hypothetical protein